MSFSFRDVLPVRPCSVPLDGGGRPLALLRPGRRVAAVGVVLALAGCSAGAEPPPAPAKGDGLGAVTTDTDLPFDHVLQDVSYAQTPPAGGQHWPPQTQDGYGWQRCGVYPEPVVDEFAVHSLEHGAVWLSYQPDAAPADIAALSKLSQVDPDYVLISPVPGQPQPFMATAWGLQLGATSPTDPALRAFTTRYAGGGQGGEKGADCANGSTIANAQTALGRLGRAS